MKRFTYSKMHYQTLVNCKINYLDNRGTRGNQRIKTAFVVCTFCSRKQEDNRTTAQSNPLHDKSPTNCSLGFRSTTFTF
jgi:hypothetical protein